MSVFPEISFSRAGPPKKGTVVVFCGTKAALSGSAQALDEDGVISKAMKAADFKAAKCTVLDIWTPSGTGLDRIVVAGVGAVDELSEYDWLKLGGKIQTQVASAAKVSVMVDMPIGNADKDSGQVAVANVVNLAMGAKLAAYKFNRYKTSKSDEEAKSAKPVKLTFSAKAATAAKNLWAAADGISDGVILARNLVNEPANVLTPVEFAKRASALSALGVKVEILTEKEMKRLGMAALLGVSQGSALPPRMAVMHWNGGTAKAAPIAFVGKGVTFDTGGISIKPAGGMEDMKGDMGGAAAVTGLMHALAARKARANVVGIIGLVENMPDGLAQRPGDIVTSMSGQTIEIINTDAEGRLVLGDLLWYCKERFKPKFMVNLATLTGAILVALGHHHAGVFSNDDDLAGNLNQAGLDTQEKVWRMPLGPEYDKLIDTKNADMKNTGGRMAGSITAAQFLQRFVGDVPWAHIDVAGTAMGSPKTEISNSWASGYGVRLLDRLVKDNYEG